MAPDGRTKNFQGLARFCYDWFFSRLLFQKNQHKFCIWKSNLFLTSFRRGPKNGSKVKKGSFKKKKNDTQIGRTWHGNELWSKFLHHRLANIKGLPKEVALTWPLTSRSLTMSPFALKKIAQIPLKVTVFFTESWQEVGPAF